jgi:hypothetical protein
MKIIQRNKKSPLTIVENFPFPFEKIELKISGSPDAWYRFYALSVKPEELGNFIYVNFIAPAVRRLASERPRGCYKFKAEFIRRIKRLSAYNYCFFEYWLKKRDEERPDPIRKVLKEFEKSGSYSHYGEKLKPKAHEITAYIMERDFGNERKTYKIPNPWTDDPDNFRRTYILNSGLVKYYRTYLKIFRNLK